MSVAGKTTRTPASVEDCHDGIRVVGAREHNLKGVSLSIPKNRITVFAGVSGSGKSSIVFDTSSSTRSRSRPSVSSMPPFPGSSGISCPSTSGPKSMPSRT